MSGRRAEDHGFDEAFFDMALEETLRADVATLGPAASGWPRTWALAACAVVLFGVTAVVGVRWLVEATSTEPAVAAPDLEPIRVLYVAALPDWQYRYTKGALLRAADEERVGEPGNERWLRPLLVQMFLDGNEGTFVQEHSPDLPALRSLPSIARLADYDVVVLAGSVPRGSVDPERSRWFEELLRRVREDGLGLCLLESRDGSWESVDVCPLEFAGSKQPTDAFQGVRMTESGRQHEILRGVTPGVWEDVRPIVTSARGFSHRPKPGARVLLEVGSASDAGPPPPGLVIHAVGQGRVALFTFEDTWRLRAAGNGENHDLLWHGVVDWLAR